MLLAAAQRWPGQVQAIHVHHGLQDAAMPSQGTARRCARELGVPLQVRRVDARHRPGDSPEDAARQALRYQALARAARDAGLKAVLLGQHADDQVETCCWP